MSLKAEEILRAMECGEMTVDAADHLMKEFPLRYDPVSRIGTIGAFHEPDGIGYGASFGGLAALLSMRISCFGGVSVVNIGNGFGAGYQASMINHMKAKSQERR